VEKTAKKFRSFAEAEQADREFYKKLTGNERLQILFDLLGPLQGNGRIDRNCVKHRKLGGSEIGELSDSP
jgi:hypothetical protein